MGRRRCPGACLIVCINSAGPIRAAARVRLTRYLESHLLTANRHAHVCSRVYRVRTPRFRPAWIQAPGNLSHKAHEHNASARTHQPAHAYITAFATTAIASLAMTGDVGIRLQWDNATAVRQRLSNWQNEAQSRGKY